MSDLFEVSTRNKDRYPYSGSRGQSFEVGIEDLWDLTPKQLKDVFGVLTSRKSTAVETLDGTANEDPTLERQLAVVRYIFGVKKAEAEAKEQEAARREKKRRLQEILERKGEEALNNMSEEELKEMLNNL